VHVFLLCQGPARNRLLVKGGSSFNALVRAMKQDLIDNGTAAKDPALLYEIDKVCLRALQQHTSNEQLHSTLMWCCRVCQFTCAFCSH
jgi:hypothetical protein